MNKIDLTKKIAIVTGAGQGIGLSIVKRFLESGASVSLWDRDKELLVKTSDGLDANERVHYAVVDISIPDSVCAGIDSTMNAFGRVDILVNNAAVVGPNANLWDYPIDAWHDVINVGLTGTFLVSRAVLPIMIKQNYGRVVNIASVAGKEGNPTASAYSAAKAGVIAMTKSLGKETARYNIAVNCVTPAIAQTTLAMSQPKEMIDYMLAKIPRGRFLQLDEAASAVAWIVSEENSFTTGAVFDLSGGRATY
ncbi:MAG: SDR family NAD(P)-dependent oxidoreductase [Chryseolinea sp.]